MPQLKYLIPLKLHSRKKKKKSKNGLEGRDGVSGGGGLGPG